MEEEDKKIVETEVRMRLGGDLDSRLDNCKKAAEMHIGEFKRIDNNALQSNHLQGLRRNRSYNTRSLPQMEKGFEHHLDLLDHRLYSDTKAPIINKRHEVPCAAAHAQGYPRQRRRAGTRTHSAPARKPPRRGHGEVRQGLWVGLPRSTQ